MPTALHLARWIGVAAVAAASLAACRGSSTEADAPRPATIERLDGSELSRVTLTNEAARRIDLKTAVVTDPRRIPFAAVLYDPDGNAWAFIRSSERGLTFQRTPITIDHVEGDTAFLVHGPTIGADVVTTGATELYGAEQGVGEDE